MTPPDCFDVKYLESSYCHNIQITENNSFNQINEVLVIDKILAITSVNIHPCFIIRECDADIFCECEHWKYFHNFEWTLKVYNYNACWSAQMLPPLRMY